MPDPDILWRNALGWLFFIAASWFILNGSLLPLQMYHPFPIMFFAIGLSIFFFLQKPAFSVLNFLLYRGSSRNVGLVFLLGGITFLEIFTWRVFEGIPHSMDGIVYLQQARIFLEGRLSMPSQPMPEFFDYVFMINDGRWFMLFQPLWSFILAIGEFFKVPWAVSPVLGGLTLWCTYHLGRRTLGEAVARLGTFIMVLSPMFMGLSGTMLNHPLSQFLTVGAFLAAVVAVEDKKRWAGFVAGLLLGLLFSTRGLNFIAIAPLVYGYLLVSVARDKINATTIALAIIGTLLGVSEQLIYNYLQMGHPLYFPQDYYFNATEPFKNCHRIGFGKGVGCPRIHPVDYFPEGYTIQNAISVTHRRLSTFVTTMVGWNGFFLLTFMGLAFQHKRSKYRYWLFSPFLALLIAYLAFYFHGVWGRYYYSAIPFICLLIADTAFGMHAWLKDLSKRRLPKLKTLGAGITPAIMTSMLAFMVIVFAPLFARGLAWDYFKVDNRLGQAIEKQDIHNAIVFITPIHFANGLVYQQADLENADVIFSHDFGLTNYLLTEQFPDRKAYLWQLPSRKLVPFESSQDPNTVIILPALQLGRTLTSGEYAGQYNLQLMINPELHPEDTLKFKFGLNLYGTGPGSYMEFRQKIPRSGMYTVSAETVEGMGNCGYKLTIAGNPLPTTIGRERRDSQWKIYEFNDPIPVPQGEIAIRATANEQSPGSLSCMVRLHRIDLKRIGDLPSDYRPPAPLPPLADELDKQYGSTDTANALSGDMEYYWYKYRTYYQLHFVFWLCFAIPLIWLIPRGSGRRRLWTILLLSLSFIFIIWGVVYGIIMTAIPLLVWGLLHRWKDRLRNDAVFRKRFYIISIPLIASIYFALLQQESMGFPVMYIPLVHIAGIAYFVPKLIHYIVEYSRGNIGKSDPLTTALYFLYFPTWRMGPIEKYPVFRKTLIAGCRTKRNAGDIAYGLYRIIIGAIKNILFFAIFQKYLLTWFDHYAAYSYLEILGGTAAGVFAVYLNFGGYTDWSIGVSRLLGIHLSENFVRPFSSPNLGVWWRRWHMSLATWVKDYIYIPLGGSRRGIVHINLTITFIMVGVWHQASLHFFIWGLLQGVGLAVVRIWGIYWYSVRVNPKNQSGIARGIQKFKDRLGPIPLIIAVLMTNYYFFSTAIFFLKDIDISVPVFLHLATFGLYPLH